MRRRTDLDHDTTARHAEEASRLARPLGTSADLDVVLDRVGDAGYVLLGEASHGTSEYYRWRAEITRRLITEKGFSFVAVEGDWPDCAAVNRWVKAAPGAGGGADGGDGARQVLEVFERWPTWMWANEEVAELATWLRDHNDGLSPERRVGFYGLDVYSLWESLRAVMEYLSDRQPDALAAAQQAWQCFEPYGEDPHEYAWSTRLVPESCEDEVVALLARLRRQVAEAGDGNGRGDDQRREDRDARFDAEQNAAVAVGAERYYRTMVTGGGTSWNVRDTHMVDTLDRLMSHHGAGAKAVVWEHNTHVGDARATDMAGAGMVNVGQLVRERHADDGVVIVGFGGGPGTVIAGRGWGAPMEVMPVPPPRDGSHEAVLDAGAPEQAVLVFPEDGDGRDGDVDWLRTWRPHRAIGVVYHPGQDRAGNWVPTVLGERYDAFLWFDRTEALHPLHLEAVQPAGERQTEPWAG